MTSEKDWWDRALVIFTAALVAVGFAQIVFLWRTVQATSENARAARLGAEALISSERPWVIVSAVDLRPPLAYIPEIGDPLDVQGRNVFGIKISSAGRTPARIMRTAMEYIKIGNFDALPNEPSYTQIDSHDALIMVPQGEPIGRIAFLKPKVILSKSDVAEIMSKGAFLYAYGFVEYKCVFDCPHCPHVINFGYVYNFPQGGEPQVLTGFMPGGPSTYNRSS